MNSDIKQDLLLLQGVFENRVLRRIFSPERVTAG
jgi:hypothetical protein